jgi:Tol biopolymer transport system component
MRLIAVACIAVAFAAASSGLSATGLRSGGLVAFAHKGPDDNGAIWLVVDDGSWTTNRPLLGRDPSFFPRWSSDGRRLLFTRPSGTYVAEVENGSGAIPTFTPPRRVTRFFGDSGVDWSPDETALALAMELRGQRCSDLYTVRSGRNRLRRLTATAACEEHPAWSPDGSLIAYQRDTDKSEIVVTDTAGATRRTVGEGTFPAWSPDGRSLAFLTAQAIVIVDARTGNKERELRPEASYSKVDEGLTWSPDGTQLAFGFLDLDEAQPLTHLASIGADGSGSTRLTLPTAAPDSDPDWLPECTLYGRPFDDHLSGYPTNDVICGLRGNDRIRAGGGDDVVYAGDGTDLVVGGLGADWLFGAAGDDRIYARDGVADLVDGGPGVDRAVVDASDRVSGVERVDRG